MLASYQLSENTEIIYLSCWNTENTALFLLCKRKSYRISSGGCMVTANGTKNSSNSSWQILDICKLTLHQPFSTRLFVWTKWCYQWLWKYVYPHVVVMLTSLLCQTLSVLPSVKNLCSTNLCKCPQHICICCKIIYTCSYRLSLDAFVLATCRFQNLSVHIRM